MDNNHIINTHALAAELEKRFIQKWNAFDTKNEFWREIFTIHPSIHEEEVDIEKEEMKYYGKNQLYLAQTNEETYRIHLTRYKHHSFDLQFKVLLEKGKNGWNEDIEEQSLSLFEKMREQIDREASRVFDNVFKENVLSLGRTNVPFSRTAYEEAVISFSEAKDILGFYVVLKPKALMVAPKLQSTIYDHIPPEDFKNWNVQVLINPYLKNHDAWFLITDAKNGFKCFERQKPQLSVLVAHDKPNPDFKPELIFKISARYSFGYSNPNAVFASTGDFSSERKAA
jgi:hypothetical protein